MDIEVIRLECLKLALEFGAATPKQIVADARGLMAFVANGKAEGKSD